MCLFKDWPVGTLFFAIIVILVLITVTLLIGGAWWLANFAFVELKHEQGIVLSKERREYSFGQVLYSLFIKVGDKTARGLVDDELFFKAKEGDKVSVEAGHGRVSGRLVLYVKNVQT